MTEVTPAPIPKTDDATVKALAKLTDTDEDEVKSLLDEEIARLFADSNVKSFIPLIARRRVKQRLRARQPKVN